MSTAQALTTMVRDDVASRNLVPGGLDRFLERIPDRTRPLIKYHHGRLLLVSPSHPHERAGDRLDAVIKAIGAVLRIDSHANASTLFRIPGFEHAVSPDRSYYIEHEADVRGLTGNIDLAIHPPPDLVIEVVLNPGPEMFLAICREMGVPEVWVYWARRPALEFLHLNEQGEYAPAATGRAFPFLTPADILPWVTDPTEESDFRWEERLRDWVRDKLGRRHEQ